MLNEWKGRKQTSRGLEGSLASNHSPHCTDTSTYQHKNWYFFPHWYWYFLSHWYWYFYQHWYWTPDSGGFPISLLHSTITLTASVLEQFVVLSLV